MITEKREPISSQKDRSSASGSDVVVIGAGLAGKAAALRLARAGLTVTCISPSEPTRAPIGESLDWSAPELLKDLGFPMERLVETGMATWKRSVTLQMRDGRSEKYIPSEWLARRPFHVELKTIHLDRFQLDEELCKLAMNLGVRFVQEKVVTVEKANHRVSAVATANGNRYPASWFIDASGIGSSLFSREFHLPKFEAGPAKVAAWGYFDVTDPVQGTTLYTDPSPSKYLDWVWEIPVNPRTVSVGVVMTGERMKERRESGTSVEEVYRQELGKYSRFEPLLAAGLIGELNVTSFRCRVFSGVAGPNWLLCGEAASMVDPITSNGVTAALRHAAEASRLILKYSARGRLPWLARSCYSRRILQMARFFNEGIEKIVYEPAIRNRIGLPLAGEVYTSPAWSMNVVYARLKPFGMVKTFVLDCLLSFFRFSAKIFYNVSRRKVMA